MDHSDMPRRKKGEEGSKSLIEMTPKQLTKEVGENTPVRVSKAHLLEIKTEKLRKTVEAELKVPKRRGS